MAAGSGGGQTVSIDTTGPLVLDVPATILARRIRSRCSNSTTVLINATATATAAVSIRVLLYTNAELGPEAFEISSGQHPTEPQPMTVGYDHAVQYAVQVAGGDARGVIFGVGKLLRDAGFDRGELELGGWRGR